MWRARDRHPWAGAVLCLTLAGSAGLAWLLLDRTPDALPGLGLVVVAVTALVLPVLAMRARPERARAQLVAAALGVAILLAGPAAYAVDTIATAHSGGNPTAGPDVASSDGSSSGAGTAGGAAIRQAPGGPGAGGAGGSGSRSLDTATVDYLVANQGDATWLVAVSDATTASTLELSTGRGVMATGGFTGSDDALSLERLQSLVASGELRFIVAGGSGGSGGGWSAGSSTSEVSSWVTSSCTVVTVDGSATSVYDCAGAVTG
jgi:4-amino-4-deoxy-L-arabinose transferase-like glycosyltransferase